MEETKLTAALPNLDIQILHREEENAEIIAVQFKATPSFEAVRGLLGPAAPGLAGLWLAPMQMWAGMVQQAWGPLMAPMMAPWLNVLSNRHLPPRR
ncbi:hypothetical protein [Azospirillum thermophilum]|uniref:hypothetical protein n=1 Tax=Azospirillum thermophilum TaxID=2202148 RepID=UPI0015E8B8F5|nr:hypothetical protein [Azospirillum thermophilum]